MPTTVGSEVTNIFNKRVLGSTDFDTRLLTSLRAIDQETLESVFKNDGMLQFGLMAGTANPKELTFGLPMRFVTAIDDMAVGEFSVAAGNNALATFTFENTHAQLYEFGCRHVRFPTRMTTNPRTGAAEYESNEIGFGEQGDPDSVVDLGGGSIEFVIDTLLDGAGIDLSGVSCLIYLKNPQSDQDATALVTAVSTYGAPNNKVTVPANGLGQSTVSVVAADYEITILGIQGIQSPGRFTAPAGGADKYIFLGLVTGTGPGNPITGPDIDQSTVTDFTLTFSDLSVLFKDTMNSLTIPGVCSGLAATNGAGPLDIDVATGFLLSAGVSFEVTAATIAIPDTNGVHYVYWNPTTEALETTTTLATVYANDWQFNPICQTTVSGAPGGTAATPVDLRHFVLESGGSRHVWTVDDTKPATFKSIEAALQSYAHWLTIVFPLPDKIIISQGQAVTAKINITNAHQGVVIEGAARGRHNQGSNPHFSWAFDGPLFEIDSTAGTVYNIAFRGLHCRAAPTANAGNEIFWLFCDTGGNAIGLTVENCIISMTNGGAAPNGYIWIQHADDLDGLIIADNAFIGGAARDAGIHIGSNLVASGLPHKICGNNVVMDKTGRLNGAISFDETGGIVLWGDTIASGNSIANVLVKDNVISTAPNNGIIVRDGTNVRVESNTIEDVDGDTSRGIYFSAATAGSVTDCWAIGNTVDMTSVATATTDGIAASTNSVNLHILDNFISMPDVENVVGINARITASIEVSRNNIRFAGNVSAAIDAIWVLTLAQPGAIVDSNIITAPKRYGIRVGQTAAVADGQIVKNNQIVNCRGIGIILDTGADKFHTVTGNDIRMAGASPTAGIDSLTCTYSKFTNNSIDASGATNTSHQGILLRAGSHNMIKGNMIDNAGGTVSGDGIAINTGADVHCQIIDNHINGGDKGIQFAAGPDHCVVKGNMITGVNIGIDVANAALDCIFAENMIDSPAVSGIIPGIASKRNILIANHIRNSVAVAVYFEDGAGTVDENVIVGNYLHVDDGNCLHLEAALSNLILGNLVDGGDGAANEDGILIDLATSGSNTIIGNVAAGNGTGSGVDTNHAGTGDVVVGNVSNPNVDTKGGDSINNNI